jgi:hypothetical protein
LQIADVNRGSSLAGQTIKSLIERGDKLQAYQVGFDLAEGGGQEFLRKVRESLGTAEDVSDSP